MNNYQLSLYTVHYDTYLTASASLSQTRLPVLTITFVHLCNHQHFERRIVHSRRAQAPAERITIHRQRHESDVGPNWVPAWIRVETVAAIVERNLDWKPMRVCLEHNVWRHGCKFTDVEIKLCEFSGDDGKLICLTIQQLYAFNFCKLHTTPLYYIKHI